MIIFLYGPDTFRSRQKLQELKNKFIREVDASGLNLETLDEKAADTEKIQSAVLSQPFLAKKRMVVLENFFSVARSEKTYERILDILRGKPADNSIIIVLERGLEPSKLKNNPLWKALQKEKHCYQFELLAPRELKAWIDKRAKELGGSISSSAAAHLAAAAGNDLWLINSELKKLCAYKKFREISLEDVKNLTSTESEESIFLLTDALGHKNHKEALRLIREFLRSQTTLQELAAKCLWQCKNLLLIKSFLQSHTSRQTSDQIAQAVGLHPYIVKKSFSQNENFTLSELKAMHQKLMDIDAHIKTGHNAPEALFDLFIMRLCRTPSGLAKTFVE